VIPNTKDVWEPAGFESFPHFRGAGDAFEQTGFIHRLMLRGTGKNRIIAVQNGFHIEVRPRHHVVGIISHPFAEGAFGLALAGHGFAFDDDLGVSGKWKAGERAFDYFDGFAADTAGKIILGHTARQRARRQ